MAAGRTGPNTATITDDDTEIQQIAIREKCFQQRPDLAQIHNHWSKASNNRPPHLMKVAERGASSMRLYERRRAAGFPGSEFLPA